MLVSVIIPAYKQEKTIEADIKNILLVMSKTRFDYEIIVVVDGFVDKTFDIASKIKDPKLKVYGYKSNRGKGYAIKYGMVRANGDYIAFIDAGMEINPNGISLLMEHMIWYNADIIVGSKRHPASNVKYTFVRKVFSNLYYLLVKILFRLKVRDTQVGLKIFRREVLETVLPRLVVKQFAFDIELLAVAKYLGYTRIYEAPVQLALDLDSLSLFNRKFSRLAKAFLIDTLGVFYRLYITGYYHPRSKQKWVQDAELDMKVNTGEVLK